MKSLLIFALILIGCHGEDPRCSQADHPDPSLENGMEVRDKGNITVDGEVCRVEEVRQYQTYCPDKLPCGFFESDTFDQCAHDYKLNCNYCDIANNSYASSPLVRRIICPSGKNGTSTVGHDGSKFHREVLQ